MENEHSRLKIHTSARRPEDQTAAQTKQESLPRPGIKKRKPKKLGLPLTTGERLIRNTAIAGALLLVVLAVRNVDEPWSDQAISGLKQAVTMRVDWDDSIGRLSFVRALVPDAALVFLNMSGRDRLTMPVNGTLTHAWTEEQPWQEYACEAGSAVLAAGGGRILAASEGMGGDWVVLIGHEGGAETTYGYLADATVQVGQTVEAGDVIGHAAQSDDAGVYFELRENSLPADPSGRFD